MGSHFVHRDCGFVESGLGIDAVEACRAEVDQENVVVRAAGNDAEAEHRETRGNRLGIVHDLSRVVAEFRLKRLVEADRLGGDDVHERAALDTWEHLSVDFLGKFLAAQDEASTRSAQAFVCGGGDEVGKRNRGGMSASGNKSRDVGHVDEEIGTYGIGDFLMRLKSIVRE